MSVEQMASAIRAAIKNLPPPVMEQAKQALAEAQQALAAATHGSSDQQAGAAAGMLGEALSVLGGVDQLIRRCKSELENYLRGLGTAESPTSIPRRPEPAATKVQPLTSGQVDPVKLDELRVGLPPPVPKPNPEGKKTHGKWIDEAGTTQQLTSGRDGDAEEAWNQLQAAGLSPSRRPAITDHVEMKLAARMVNQGTTHTDVVLNNRPCAGLLSCDRLLPVILPAGYSLTVHGPNYRKTFTGGKKWSS